jgi:hypothetical protein
MSLNRRVAALERDTPPPDLDACPACPEPMAILPIREGEPVPTCESCGRSHRGIFVTEIVVHTRADVERHRAEGV